MESTSGERRVQTVCLLLIAAVAVGAALHWLSPVLIPFILALFFRLALAPLVGVLTGPLRFPRWLAVLGTLLLGVSVLGALLSLVSASVGQLTANSDAYQEQAAALLESITAILPLEALGVDPSKVLDPLQEIPLSAVGGFLVGTTNAVVDIISQSFLVLIFLIFLLVASDGAAPAEEGDTWDEISSGVERYILTKSLVSAATGLLVWAVLALLGVELALVFGLFAFLLNFIPSIGSVIATLLPLPVVIMSPTLSTAAATVAIVVPGIIQFSIGNVIEPRLMGRSLDLHPVVILLALIFWGMLWGTVGMLLAAPMTAVMKILFEKLELTRPVAEVLAGRLDALRSSV